jgi:hypothetical protein
MSLWRCMGMAHRPQASPHPDASRAQPVFTTCHPCTAGRHQPSVAPSWCDRLFNPQTTQPQPGTRAPPLPIGCSPAAPGPQRPQPGAPGPACGGPHQRCPAGLPQAAPAPSQAERRGAWGEPCSLALGDAITSRDPKRDEGVLCFPRTTGGDSAIAVSGGGGLGGEEWCGVCWELREW